MILVVPEENVEAGLVGLDEAVLEDQRLALGVGDDNLDVLHAVHQPVEAGAIDARFLKVGPHAASERARFSDVQDLPALALEEVDPRGPRKVLELLAQLHAHLRAFYSAAAAPKSTWFGAPSSVTIVSAYRDGDTR